LEKPERQRLIRRFVAPRYATPATHQRSFFLGHARAG
jgi:hypothetical protein